MWAGVDGVCQNFGSGWTWLLVLTPLLTGIRGAEGDDNSDILTLSYLFCQVGVCTSYNGSKGYTG